MLIDKRKIFLSREVLKNENLSKVFLNTLFFFGSQLYFLILFWRLGTKSEENFSVLSNKQINRERSVAKTKSINKKKIKGAVGGISNDPRGKDGNARFPFLINNKEDFVLF